jgi:hypothetical protein
MIKAAQRHSSHQPKLVLSYQHIYMCTEQTSVHTQKRIWFSSSLGYEQAPPRTNTRPGSRPRRPATLIIFSFRLRRCINTGHQQEEGPSIQFSHLTQTDLISSPPLLCWSHPFVSLACHISSHTKLAHSPSLVLLGFAQSPLVFPLSVSWLMTSISTSYSWA